MRFKFIDRMLAAVSGLLIVALGLAAIVVGAGLFPEVDFGILSGPFVLWQKIAIIGGGVILVLLGIHGLHMLFRRRYGKNFIVQRTDMGDMSIAISALHNMVNKCVEQHQEICIKKIDINRVRGGIIVDLKILLANGINIPLTVNVLQKQIKQYITSCSGIDVHEVRVQIGTSDKAVKGKKKPIAALEQAPAVVALQDQTESAADSILQHTEEPSDYVEPVEYVEQTAEAVETVAEETVFATEEIAEEIAAEQPVVEEAIYTETPAEAVGEAAEYVQEAVYAEEAVEAVEALAEAAVEETETYAEAASDVVEQAEAVVEDAADEASYTDFYAAQEESEPKQEENDAWTVVGDAFVRQDNESEETAAE